MDHLEAGYYSTVNTPVGELVLVADDAALTGLYFGGCAHVPDLENSGCILNAGHPVLTEATRQLAEYFLRKRTCFSIPLRLSGTEFQKRIWAQIAGIPYGVTISYQQLATRAGAPLAVRAAGASTGRNPVAIIVPCHRVIGKDGAITGFAGGLDIKRQLLELEAPANPATLWSWRT